MSLLSINQLISSSRDNPYPVLEISEEALTHNFSLIKKITGENVKTLIPVKANAYGLGIDQLVPFFKKVRPDYLGVANPFEGAQLRQFGWDGKILNLGGFYPEVSHLLFENNITPSITDIWQVEYLEKICRERDEPIEIHIKLDLGMGRIGIMTKDIFDLSSQIKQSSYLKVKGIFTHFPSADRPEALSNQNILKDFESCTGEILNYLELRREDAILHSANSYSMILNPASHFDMVRPGICFYGYFSTPQDQSNLYREFPFMPSLRLKARPISLRKLSQGSTVSYGETYRVENQEESVGVIPLGYADGIPRQISNMVNFNGHPLLGRVTMDQIIVGGIFEESQVIEILGTNSTPVEKWAELSGTISYEILTRLGDRITRKLV